MVCFYVLRPETIYCCLRTCVSVVLSELCYVCMPTSIVTVARAAEGLEMWCGKRKEFFALASEKMYYNTK